LEEPAAFFVFIVEEYAVQENAVSDMGREDKDWCIEGCSFRARLTNR
jgi:hypothetical protein